MKKIRIPAVALALAAGVLAAHAAINRHVPDTVASEAPVGLDDTGIARMAADRLFAFEVFDADRDGYIAAHEAIKSAPLFGRFEDIDADGDGRVSFSEWSEYFRHLSPRG